MLRIDGKIMNNKRPVKTQRANLSCFTMQSYDNSLGERLVLAIACFPIDCVNVSTLMPPTGWSSVKRCLSDKHKCFSLPIALSYYPFR